MAFPQLFCVDSVLRFDIAQMPGYILTGGRFNAAARYSLGAAKKWGERQTLQEGETAHAVAYLSRNVLTAVAPFAFPPPPPEPAFFFDDLLPMDCERERKGCRMRQIL